MVKAFIGHCDPSRFKQKHVLVRADYNVPLRQESGKVVIVSDAKINNSLDTLRFLLDQDAKIVLISHLGRPKGNQDKDLSLMPIAEYLQRLLPDIQVSFFPDCIGEGIKQSIKNQPNKSIILLENLRFHPEEMNNDDTFAQELAKGIDVFVNDAWAVCHRGKL
jgi:phosphoglycerate kinase